MRDLIAFLALGLALAGCNRSPPVATAVPVATPGPEIGGGTIAPGRCWGTDPYGARVRIPC